ncbi:hypothetical protein ACFVSU_09160 [Microbacterium sp. NPDC058062]|uniref:hypothetical protein n=1 Tax=Microbacterium sp. NPDC058062 TaxID=3346320 RepID=UPI0036DAA32B
MFRTLATVAHDSSPVLSDWTIGELLEWIGDDDARCHDATLVGLLAEIDEALAPRSGAEASVLAPTSPVPLVRSLTTRLRTEPALRDARVGDVVEVGSPHPAVIVRGDDARGAGVRGAASLRAPRLRVS